MKECTKKVRPSLPTEDTTCVDFLSSAALTCLMGEYLAARILISSLPAAAHLRLNTAFLALV
jgi:hypothetical protein